METLPKAADVPAQTPNAHLYLLLTGASPSSSAPSQAHPTALGALGLQGWVKFFPKTPNPSQCELTSFCVLSSTWGKHHRICSRPSSWDWRGFLEDRAVQTHLELLGNDWEAQLGSPHHFISSKESKKQEGGHNEQFAG